MSRKVHPITGKHTTLHSMLAEAMTDQRAKSGFVVYFEEDGTMHFGEIGMTVGNTAMAYAHFTHLVAQMMGQQ